MKPHFNNDKIGDLIIHVQTKNLIELDFWLPRFKLYAVTLTAVTSEFSKVDSININRAGFWGSREIQNDFNFFFRDKIYSICTGDFTFFDWTKSNLNLNPTS